MTQYRKKPVVISAITFAELVAHGKAQLKESELVNGMPWAFHYAGQPITHHSDTCYLIPTLEGNMRMGPDDMLITGVAGEIYPCKCEIFDATYEPAPLAQSSTLSPHQQRVLDEKAELDERLSKLVGFFSTSIFHAIPESEQIRLESQAAVMRKYSVILGERIVNF